jgi:outer membrane protein OmpA-like peptidoglycan-associated protein
LLTALGLLAVLGPWSGSGLAQADDTRAALFAVAADARESALEARAALLAPEGFETGSKAFDRATEDYERGRSLDRIRRNLDEATTEFQRATAAAGVARRNLAGLLKDREAAIEAGAHEVADKDWDDGERGFRRAAVALEHGEAQDALRHAEAASESYRAAELDAIKKRLLDSTRVLIDQARQDRVQKVAPKTLGQAEALLAAAEDALEQDRYDTDRPRDLARQANYQARHAIFLAAFIQSLKQDKTSTEELILSFEEPLRRVAAAGDIVAEFDQGAEPVAASVEAYLIELQDRAQRLEQDLAERTQQVYALEQEVTDVYARLGGVSEERQALEVQLQRQAMERQRLAEVEALFSPDQARVLRQGDEVVVRLVGLNFRPASSEIPAAGADLLRSLETALRLYPDAAITVAGHTDAFGSDAANFDLSRRRAESVRSHLLRTMNLPANRVSAVGYGETQPVASNQTPEGRARNRRIDVMIRPRD